MRHLKRNKKLGRKGDHRNAMLANLVSSLIKHKRVTTTLAKAKAARPVAEKLLTLGKLANEALATASSASDAASKAKATAANVHNRRLVAARLRQQSRSHFKGTPTAKGKELREAWKAEHDVVQNAGTPAFCASDSARAIPVSWPSSSGWTSLRPPRRLLRLRPPDSGFRPWFW